MFMISGRVQATSRSQAEWTVQESGNKGDICKVRQGQVTDMGWCSTQEGQQSGAFNMPRLTVQLVQMSSWVGGYRERNGERTLPAPPDPGEFSPLFPSTSCWWPPLADSSRRLRVQVNQLLGTQGRMKSGRALASLSLIHLPPTTHPPPTGLY